MRKLDFEVAFSKKGLPCLWESGGGLTSTGRCFLIADSNGLPKKAIYIRTSGSLACDNHALVPIEIGDYIVFVDRHRDNNWVQVCKIEAFSNDNKVASTVIENEFEFGEWDVTPPTFLDAVIQSAINKAHDYHCRVPYYVEGYFTPIMITEPRALVGQDEEYQSL